MPSIIPGNSGPSPINRPSDPAQPATVDHGARADLIGQLAGRTVRLVSAGEELRGMSLETLHGFLDRLNAAEAEQNGGPRLSSRTVTTADASVHNRRAEVFSLRLAASASAGGALFNATLHHAGLQPDLMSDTQRMAIDAAVAGVATSRCSPDIANTILQAAVEAGARHVLRLGPESDGSSAVRAAVANTALTQAAEAMARNEPARAARWLAEGARALSADRGAMIRDGDAVFTALEGALEGVHTQTKALVSASTSDYLTNLRESPHISQEISQYFRGSNG